MTAPASWVPGIQGHEFGLHTLPYGVFSTGSGGARVAVAVGDFVLDVSRVDVPFSNDLARPALNGFMARGPAAWRAVRSRLVDLLTGEEHRAAVAGHLHPLADVVLHLPFEIADYVDFYSSEHHATNVGRIFRPDGEPLPPAWRSLPIGYHGRAGTVVVSGTPVVRPCGLRRPPGASGPEVGPTGCLDFEAEVGFVVGVRSAAGSPVPIADFAEHVFGVVLVNDWSARDIQAFETVPLGPFLGKSFATSISPWVVPLAALGPARVVAPAQDPVPAPYLRSDEPWGLDLDLVVECNGTVLSRPPLRRMYWTAAQQFAHLTVNGARLRTGDLYASGTVSGPTPDQYGSLLELTCNGTRPVTLGDGSIRTFLADGDTVTIRGSAPGPDGARVGLGAVTGMVLARPPDRSDSR